MKRKIMVFAVVVMLLVTAFVVVRAKNRGGHRWCGHRWHHPGPGTYLAHELKLRDAQRAQIRILWEAQRPIFSAHVHEFLAESKEMNAMTVQREPDQNEVKAIADREATTIAALLVEKERLQSNIYSTVLNPQQRAKADELQKKWESRLDRLADHLGTQPAER